MSKRSAGSGKGSVAAQAAGEKEAKPRVARKRLSGEVAGVGGDILRSSLIGPGGTLLNADDILTLVAPSKIDSHGQLRADPYALYRIMRRSNMKVKALFETRRNGVLSKPWRVVPSADDPDAKRAGEVAAFVQAVLNQVEDFHADLRELLDAIPTGFAVSEVIWVERQIRVGGAVRYSWVPVALKQRRQGRFAFHRDDWRLMYSPLPGQYVETEPMKFVVLSHRMENEDRYGTAEAAEVFWYWFMVRESVRWWAIFNEKFGQPTATVKYKPNATAEQKEKALRAAKMIQTEYAIAIPDNLVIDFLEAKRTGSVGSYSDFVEWAERGLSEAITGQSLATGQGSSGRGSYAQAETHADVKEEFVEADCKELAGAINSQLIRWIVDWNYGPNVPAPVWRIEYESEDLMARLEMDGKLVDLGAEITVSYLHETYSRPRRKGNEPLAERRNVGGLLPAPAEREPRGKRQKDEDADGGDDEEGGGQFGARRTFSADPLIAEAERRVQERERIAGTGLEWVRQAYRQLYASVTAEVGKAASLAELDQSLWKLGHGAEFGKELGAAIADAWLNLYLMGGGQIVRWKADQAGALEPARTFAGKKSGLKALTSFVGLRAAKAIDWFRSLVPMTTTELESTYREVAVAAFSLGRDASKQVLERVQESIGKALEEGTSLTGWKDEYERILGEEGMPLETAREAEDVYRRETAKAYAAGQNRVMEDPEIRKAFPMRMRIAIMDNRTRDTHRAMHRLALAADDPFWLAHTPPDDYRCRCTVVELTHKYIEMHGIKGHEGMLKLPNGTEFDPRALGVPPAYRF